METETPPTSQRAVILAWLAGNPGFHTPAEVAKGTGVTTQFAANALSRMALRGRVLRHRHPTRRNGPGSSLFSAPGGNGASTQGPA